MTPYDLIIERWATDDDMPPFIDTVNTQPSLDTVPDVWGSAMVQVETRTDVTLGSNPTVEERGNIVVGLFARAGTGPAALDAYVDEARTLFHGYVKEDGSNTFQCLRVDGPMDVDAQSDGEWWQVALMVPYTYQSKRTEPV